jgi:low temperature requirement protein LtrA
LLDRLATMTADPAWVPAHALVVLSTVLLAAGLALAARHEAWPTAQKALRVAVVAISLYLVETLFHLAAAVDSHALHHGQPAPVAFTHLGLSVLLYPVAASRSPTWLRVSSSPGAARAASPECSASSAERCTPSRRRSPSPFRARTCPRSSQPPLC